jgi:hypothetical protein
VAAGRLLNATVAKQAAQAAKNKVTDADLIQLEKRLNDEVDEDFFEELGRFNTARGTT